MELPIFYCPPELRRDDIIELPADESHHAISVMRLSQADRVIVVDGVGTAYRGEIARIVGGKKVEVRLHLEIRNFGEPAVVLTLAAGLSVGSKFDTVVQEGTELGVKRFVPIISERSKVKLDDPTKASAKTRRLERVALAAIKQCRRSYRPDISLPVSFAEYMKQADSEDLKLIFQPGDRVPSLEQIRIDAQTKRITALVGPESGFTPDEVDLAGKAGFILVSLGPRILRTETAGPVACALVMNMLGELR
jgi:16S rRNA (uracil1498-N3)-methyltransferase